MNEACETDGAADYHYPDPQSRVWSTSADNVDAEGHGDDDWVDMRPCQCTREDTEDYWDHLPTYPELGSYVKKSHARSSSKKVLIKRLDDLNDVTQLSQDLVNLHNYSSNSSRQNLNGFHQSAVDEFNELTNFTPEALATMRGTKARLYQPVETDPIDREVKRQLNTLEQDVAGLLSIRRKMEAVYEVDGREVYLYWAGRPDSVQELYCHEIAVGDNMPFFIYLEQVTNVLLSMHRQLPACSMTFLEEGTNLKSVHDGGRPWADVQRERDEAMRTACSQAEFRKGFNSIQQDNFQCGLNGMALRV
jgi:hypothetical protein